MIIHHTAPSLEKDWHSLWKVCRFSWLKTHKDSKFILWKDEDLDTLVKEKFPMYYSVYRNLPASILRIDFARYCLLYEFGGIYADMDMYCYREFFQKLDNDFCVVESVFSEDEREFVQNSLMYSTLKNPLMKEVMDMSFERLQKMSGEFLNGKNKNSRETLYLTGPVLLSDFYLQNKDRISLLNASQFNNLFGSYDESFYTKHVNTVLWGKEMQNQPKEYRPHYHIVNGHRMITGKPFPNQIIELSLKRIFNYECVEVSTFDFHFDYARGIRYQGPIPCENKYVVRERFERVLREFGIQLYTT